MILVPYYTSESLSGPDVVSLIYDGSLRVTVADAAGVTFQIGFPGVQAFRLSDEGDRLEFVYELSSQHKKPFALVYEVRDSSFISWLNDESNGIWASQPKQHYVIVTNNDIIDVIARMEPGISMGPSVVTPA